MAVSTAVVISLLVACGGSRATSVARPTSRPTPSPPPATSAPSPEAGTATPAPSEAGGFASAALPPPLEALSSAGSAALYRINGRELASLPDASLYSVASPLGSRLLLEHLGAAGVDELAALSADGSIQDVANVNPEQFRDAIGSPDGAELAWMLGGPAGCGSGTAAGGITEVHVSRVAPGSGSQADRLSPLRGGVPWSFMGWTREGIVLREGALPCGASNGPSVSSASADLLDPTTGTVTSIAPRLGAGCALQAFSQTGTMVCSPPSSLEGSSLAPAAVLLRMVSPDGGWHDLAVGTLAAGCSGAQFGDIRVSDDGDYASLSRWCFSGTGARVTLWIVDTATLNLTEVSTTANLQVAGWLPGSDNLLAVAFARWQGTLAPSVTGTYVISDSGAASKIMPALLVAAGVTHP